MDGLGSNALLRGVKNGAKGARSTSKWCEAGKIDKQRGWRDAVWSREAAQGDKS